MEAPIRIDGSMAGEPSLPDTHHFQYYAQQKPPAFTCPREAEGIENMEDCLVAFRENNIFHNETPCFRCPTGLHNRNQFSGVKQTFRSINRTCKSGSVQDK